jgi:hypothetical protein
MNSSKTFCGDFYKFLNKIKNKENFAVSRFGDGELFIIEGNDIDLLNKGAGEFAYKSNDVRYETSRNLLSDSFTSVLSEYYIGIACKCCVGEAKFTHMIKASRQPPNHLTWANIFVNSNYKLFLNEFLPELNNRRLAIICHTQSNTYNLPFNIDDDMIFKVSANAWVNNLDLIDILKHKIQNEDMRDVVFLMAAGPFANILSHQLFKFNRHNTYLDIGSTLDTYLSLPITRNYLKGASTLNKICIW